MMKCDYCFFCTHIGKGIYGKYPVKYCKYHKKHLLPFVYTQDNGGTYRELDFENAKDCETWHKTGCNIHPSRVEKARKEFIESLEKPIRDRLEEREQ